VAVELGIGDLGHGSLRLDGLTGGSVMIEHLFDIANLRSSSSPGRDSHPGPRDPRNKNGPDGVSPACTHRCASSPSPPSGSGSWSRSRCS
jgi:hypothetical protein